MLWRSRGARFITEPKVRETEMRCYMLDPDGYLIEVGQTTITVTPLSCIVDAGRETGSRRKRLGP